MVEQPRKLHGCNIVFMKNVFEIFGWGKFPTWGINFIFLWLNYFRYLYYYWYILCLDAHWQPLARKADTYPHSPHSCIVTYCFRMTFNALEFYNAHRWINTCSKLLFSRCEWGILFTRRFLILYGRPPNHPILPLSYLYSNGLWTSTVGCFLD